MTTFSWIPVVSRASSRWTSTALVFPLLCLTLCLANVSFAADSLKILSPNGRVAIDVSIDSDASYAVTFDGATVLEPSKLGLTFRDVSYDSLKLVETTRRSIDETWTPTCGRNSSTRDRCVEATLTLAALTTGGAARKFDVVFRAYDDGFAFRYVLPRDGGWENGDGELCVESEETQFAFGQDRDVWAAFFGGFASNQEGNFQKKRLSDIKSDSFVGMPLVVESSDFVLALTEADLLDWSGAQFASSPSDSSTVVVRLTPRDDKRGAVVRKTPCASPWRVGILGKRPIDLINASDLIANLATPCAIDASWVKPGNSSWDWWAPKGSREISNEKIREFIDFTVKMNWDYTLVDAGWYRLVNKENGDGKELVVKNGLDVPGLVQYGKEKGVGVLLWIDWPDIIKVDVRDTLKRCADWGVQGVKIDHMNSHSQETVAALTETVKIAAEYRLLVNFHGMYKPTGLERTYPNQITREGVRGNEYFRGRMLTPSFVATLPFTRFLIGPADYTPGGFRNEHSETYKPLKELDEPNPSCRVVGTRAHELALCTIFDSPLRCLCDLPSVYEGKPGLEYLNGLPSSWDETRALDGAIGEFIVVARRLGDAW